MSMLREEYEDKAAAVLQFFEPGKVIFLSGARLTMISLNNEDSVSWSINSGIAFDQLPNITCSYQNKNGTLKFIVFEYKHITALKTISI